MVTDPAVACEDSFTMVVEVYEAIWYGVPDSFITPCTMKLEKTGDADVTVTPSDPTVTVPV
jgi:hypothetical protein